jgi:hypothetical protein
LALVAGGAIGCGQSVAVPGDYVRVDVGNGAQCALLRDGRVSCRNTMTPPSGSTFTAVGAGQLFACGLTSNQTIECWGANDGGQAKPPAGTFTQVTTGEGFACGLRPGGAVECWGDSKYQVLVVPAESFQSIGAGAYHACGVTVAGNAVCWGGVNAFGASTPPATEPVAHVEGGSRISCALLVSGAVVCRGLTPPDGTFEQLTVGYTHACGLRPDRTVECWGDDAKGQATAPPGEFASVSGGWELSCGVRAEGTISCWGQSAEGVAAFFAQR